MLAFIQPCNCGVFFNYERLQGGCKAVRILTFPGFCLTRVSLVLPCGALRLSDWCINWTQCLVLFWVRAKSTSDQCVPAAQFKVLWPWGIGKSGMTVRPLLPSQTS